MNFIKDKLSRLDPVIFICTAFLSLMSIVTIFAARETYGVRSLIMQVAMTFAGMLFAVVLANLDFRNSPTWFYIGVFGLSVALLGVLLVYGESAGTNQNWIKIPGIGISIQPSEFVRASFILTFSKHLSLVRDEINKPLTVLGLAVHAGIIMGVLLLTGDLGMVLVYCGIMAVMLFCAGLSMWYFLAAIIIIVIAFPFLWEHLAPYQQQRILVGFNPDIDPLDKGLQQIQSRTAIAGGGFFGRGITGAGSYKAIYGCLTDFFFATYAEMFGFVGSLLLIDAEAVLVLRLFRLARRTEDAFSSILLSGVAGMVVVQSVENLGMCLCLLPVVGITLPFLSAGGSSVLSIYLIIGLAHSVSKN